MYTLCHGNTIISLYLPIPATSSLMQQHVEVFIALGAPTQHVIHVVVIRVEFSTTST